MLHAAHASASLALKGESPRAILVLTLCSCCFNFRSAVRHNDHPRLIPGTHTNAINTTKPPLLQIFPFALLNVYILPTLYQYISYFVIYVRTRIRIELGRWHISQFSREADDRRYD